MATVTLLTGGTGSGKTSQLSVLAEWLYERHGKRSRLVTADGGGFGTHVEALADLGIIEVWKVRSRASGLAGEGLVEETLARASQGAWPISLDGNGMCPPGCKLQMPVEIIHTMRCPQGHKVREGTQPNLSPIVCGQCRVTVDAKNAKMEQAHRRTVPDDIGAYFFEGMTSFAAWFMQGVSRRRAVGEPGLDVGQKSAAGRLISGEYALGGNTLTDYGLVQTEADKWLQNSTTIPGLLLPPIWTALEEFSDKKKIWGPSLAGEAKIGDIPQWVGNWIGLQTFQGENGRFQRRLYLSEYKGEDGYSRKYKCRAFVGALPPFLQDDACPRCDASEPCDGGAPHFVSLNLGVLFNSLETSREKLVEAKRVKFPNAPGRATSPEPSAPPAIAAAEPAVRPGPPPPQRAPAPIGPRPVVLAPKVPTTLAAVVKKP